MANTRNEALRELKQNWEDLADMDPLWSILTEPGRKHGRWDIDEFFRTGEREVTAVMETARELGYPSGREWALDFGCGVGRLTRALARFFQHCYGVDISESMVAKAKDLNRSVTNCNFILNGTQDLGIFPGNFFDMIYTGRVLQHFPTQGMIKSSICDFVRVLRVGGLLVFQLPSRIPFRNKLYLRKRLYGLLTRMGFNKGALYGKLGFAPLRINFISEREVIGVLDGAGAKVLKIESDSLAGPSVSSRTYYVTK